MAYVVARFNAARLIIKQSRRATLYAGTSLNYNEALLFELILV
jgi:hypothetical protein